MAIMIPAAPLRADPMRKVREISGPTLIPMRAGGILIQGRGHNGFTELGIFHKQY